MSDCICKWRRSSYPSDIDPATRIPNPDCEAHKLYPGDCANDTGYHRPNIDGECSDCGADLDGKATPPTGEGL